MWLAGTLERHRRRRFTRDPRRALLCRCHPLQSRRHLFPLEPPAPLPLPRQSSPTAAETPPPPSRRALLRADLRPQSALTAILLWGPPPPPHRTDAESPPPIRELRSNASGEGQGTTTAMPRRMTTTRRKGNGKERAQAASDRPLLNSSVRTMPVSAPSRRPPKGWRVREASAARGTRRMALRGAPLPLRASLEEEEPPLLPLSPQQRAAHTIAVATTTTPTTIHTLAAAARSMTLFRALPYQPQPLPRRPRPITIIMMRPTIAVTAPTMVQRTAVKVSIPLSPLLLPRCMSPGRFLSMAPPSHHLRRQRQR